MVHFQKNIPGKFFFSEKRANGQGGGPRGVCQKGTIFPVFFRHPSLTQGSKSKEAYIDRRDMFGRKTGRETTTPRIEKMFTLVTYSHPGILCPHTKHNGIWYKTDDELGDDEEQNQFILFIRGIQVCHMNADVLPFLKMWWFLAVQNSSIGDLGSLTD